MQVQSFLMLCYLHHRLDESLEPFHYLYLFACYVCSLKCSLKLYLDTADALTVTFSGIVIELQCVDGSHSSAISLLV